jgi:hypothetical protein
VTEFEARQRAWHAAWRRTRPDLEAHHWEPSFGPVVQAPLLAALDDPPTEDRATVAALRGDLQQASTWFAEAARRWAAGDKRAAEAAEAEAFRFEFQDFWGGLSAYGVTEDACAARRG